VSLEDALAKIPPQGFLKTKRDPSPSLSGKDKVALLRRGNELASKGHWEQAKKIFVTTGNTDGMIRCGDYYLKKGDYLLALQMYKLAPAPDKAEPIIQKMAWVIQEWLKE